MFELKEKTDAVNPIIEEYLPVSQGEGSIEEAMRYSVLNGGKRLRPIMLLEACRLFSADRETEKMIAWPFAAAIEFIHSYSLVHDDLPAMDNDTYRRGKLTTHKKFGHAMGVLAGDALLNYAFEVMSSAAVRILRMRASEMQAELIERIACAMAEISEKAGYLGMIKGQVMDCNGEENMDTPDILKTYELKTSCLFEAALAAGAVLGGADPDETRTIKNAGYHIGIAFQLKDDILDGTASFEKLGKDTASDERNGKVTYLSLNGMEETEKKLAGELEKAVSEIEKLPGDHTFFDGLCRFLGEREF